MNKSKSICQINFIFIILFILFLPFKTRAVVIASDKFYLYENDQKINDNSVIANGKISINGEFDLTQDFTLTQITFYKTKEPNLLEYNEWKSKSFLDNKNCAEYIMLGWENWWQEWIKEAKESYARSSWIKERELRVEPQKKSNVTKKLWDERVAFMLETGGFDFSLNLECKKYTSHNEYSNYIQNYINNAIYSTTINIPKAEDTKVRGVKPGVIGGIMGTGRCFNVDIKTKGIKQVECLLKTLKREMPKYYLIIPFVFLFISIIVIFLYKKRNKNIK